MSEPYIEYWYTKTKNSFTRDENYELDRISFKDLERHTNCIDWFHISGFITKETCTEDFYTKFSKYLNWKNGKFLEYVSEEYLLLKLSEIEIASLFSGRKFSEDFCVKAINSEFANEFSFRYRRLLECIIVTQKLSTEFFNKYILSIFDIKPEKNTYNWEIESTKNYIADLSPYYQKFTDEQFLKYVDGNKYFKKFNRFVILSSENNNFSKEFIKAHKKDLNEKSFLTTKQVTNYLSNHKISKNALEIFKDRIDWIALINKAEIKDIEYMFPLCKKEFFNVFIKYSDDIYPRKLDGLRDVLKM